MNRWVLVLSAVVSVAAAADIWVAVRPSRPIVSQATMVEAARQIAEEAKPGDLVVHSPLLTVEELAGLGELSARPDLPLPVQRARRRVLALDFAATPMFGLGRPSTEQVLEDGLVLRIYPPTGEALGALWRLSDNLRPTTMRVERQGRSRRCDHPRAEGGFGCPTGEPDWLYAATRVLRVGRQDRECVWAHPTTGGTVVLTVPPLPVAVPGASA